MLLTLRTFTVPGLTAGSQTETTFRGRPARTGTFTAPAGQHVTATLFFYSDTRMYTLLAESGTASAELAASFVALP